MEKPMTEDRDKASAPENMKVPPAEAASETFVEKSGGETFVEGTGNNFSSPDAARRIELGGVVYAIVRRIPVGSAEADLYVVERGDGVRYVLKNYRHGIRPKVEVLEKIAALSSHDVIGIAGFGTAQSGRFYELQEYAGFGSVENVMTSGRELDEEFIGKFVVELNSCLREIHSHGIIHRDIKPANILVRSRDPLDLVLTDFGISSAAELSMHQTGLSRTIIYSAPETLTGVISKAVDYWSFGIILLHMVKGVHPFEKLSEAEVLFALSSRPVPGAAEVSGPFAQIIRGLLTRDARSRWGFDEVSRWTGGDRSVPEYFEDSYKRDGASDGALRPFALGDRNYLNAAELAEAMSGSRDLAIEAFRSGLLREWVSGSLRDRKISFLVDELSSDGSLSDDEKIFEFVYRVNPGLAFRYAGKPVTAEFLVSAGWRAAKGERDDDTRFFDTVVRGGIMKKYFALASDVHPELKNLSENIDSVESASSAIEAAVMALALLGPEPLSLLSKAVSEKFGDAVVVKPARGFADEEETFKSAESFGAGGALHHTKIVHLFLAGDSVVVKREAIAKLRDELSARCVKAFAEFPLFYGNLTDALTGGPGRRFVESVVSGSPEFTREYYLKLCELRTIFERRYSELARRSAAVDKPVKKEPPPEANSELPKSQSPFGNSAITHSNEGPNSPEPVNGESEIAAEIVYYVKILAAVLALVVFMRFVGENFRGFMASLGVIVAIAAWVYFRAGGRY